MSGDAALFVSFREILLDEGGGVQVCNREYMETLGRAGFELHIIPFDFPHDLFSRLSRRLSPEIGLTKAPTGLFVRICRALTETSAHTVFFAHTMFADLSRELKRAFPSVKQVLLSHGAEGFDFCIEESLRRSSSTEIRFRPIAERMIGRVLLNQLEQRRWIDAVLTLSPFEVEIEKWLGAGNAFWVPRAILGAALTMQPISHRVGCVSTLSHSPNFEGLKKIFCALQQRCSPELRFRLVGSPSNRGEELANRFRFVDYLGYLSDSELRTEATSWCCFVNPIFHYAKGCSTKLAVALGWGLPIASTVYGARGYCWDQNVLPLARSPAELADLVLERAVLTSIKKYQRQTADIRDRTPDIQTSANQIRAFLSAAQPGLQVKSDLMSQAEA